MKVTIFGTGYVGLVMGACLADSGNEVLCVDVDAKKIELLRSGGIPIFEPGLEALVTKNVREGRLLFTTDAKEGVDHAMIQFIAVGTPPDEDGSADLTHVLHVARSIGTSMKSYKIVVDKSTVPVGTADKVAQTIRRALAKRKKTTSFDVVSNPEFLKEGAAIEDFMKPGRIIVGTSSARAKKELERLFLPFSRSREKIQWMDVRSAELTKYAANSFLATKISFMNDLSNLAEKLGADIEAVRRGIGSDERIGRHFLYAGCGYGGSCFPKDVKALLKTAQESGHNLELLQSVENVNKRQKSVLFKKIQAYFGSSLKGKTIAVWGLAFKPNTDDMREASSRVLLESLWKSGARVRAFDPAAMEETRRIYGQRKDLELCLNPEEALMGADALVVVTEWQVFRSPDFSLLASRLARKVVFDGRNMYDPTHLKEAGLEYFSIGRA